jgi:hypothetical protein
MKQLRFALPLLILLLVGCATGPSMKPDDILYRAESLYVAQYVDYLGFFAYDPVNDTWETHPWITEEEKVVLRQRKKVLENFGMAISVYRGFVKIGQPPSYEAEQELISFIRQFQQRGL